MFLKYELSDIYYVPSMPHRNRVPSLKYFCSKKVAWPDAVMRHSEEINPSIEQYCRDSMYKSYLNENKSELLQWLGEEKLQESYNFITNIWIHISNYHVTTLEDFNQIALFIRNYPPTRLDFIHETETFHVRLSENNYYQCPLDYILKIPRTRAQNSITPAAWLKIVDALQKNNALEAVRDLRVRFKAAPRDSTGDPVLRSNLLMSTDLDVPESFKLFVNLTTLVIRGSANDDLLEAVATSCYKIRHIDISESEVTFKGVRSLFYKSEEEEKRYLKACREKPFWGVSKYPLRPLTKSLEYFDMSHLMKMKEHYVSPILIACPQLVATPSRLFFKPKGVIRMECRNFKNMRKLSYLRQQIVMNTRTVHCEDLFDFIYAVLTSLGAISYPSLQIRVDENGNEISFLLMSDNLLMIRMDVEDAKIISLFSYAPSAFQFIELSKCWRFLPSLQTIKAPLKGVLENCSQFQNLKHVATIMVHRLDTIKSILDHCPNLMYLEIMEVLLHPTMITDKDIHYLFESSFNNLEILRLNFQNQISINNGFSKIVTQCPNIKLIGDLKKWAVPHKCFRRLLEQVKFHNYDFTLEYDGVLFHGTNELK